MVDLPIFDFDLRSGRAFLGFTFLKDSHTMSNSTSIPPSPPSSPEKVERKDDSKVLKKDGAESSKKKEEVAEKKKTKGSKSGTSSFVVFVDDRVH